MSKPYDIDIRNMGDTEVAIRELHERQPVACVNGNSAKHLLGDEPVVRAGDELLAGSGTGGICREEGPTEI